MKTFEELQDTWNQQTESNLKPEATDLIQKAEAHTKMIKRNHFWTRLILSLSSILLIAYYIWVAAYKHTIFNIGLCIMITMLLLRIILEWVSEKKLENLKSDATLIEYSKQAHQFYSWRKKIHYIFTPVIYLVYIAGFIFLLPVFKANFSHGFYLYILISGFGFFLIFGLFMIRKIKKELALLQFLKNIS
ncbi:hypothetical protein [Flavobacterium denitrificans]|uniref:hypothetical protein n=1 Tax=Flavobacterium denitrificans TaxID=281361 RepID=UPI0003FC1B88|nr:hypothetical protein [Flavobacterium denitrificans]